VGVPSREEIKTTRERGAGRENTEKGQPGGGKDNVNNRPAASDGKKKRDRNRTETKNERGEHT
jgi:hypothetical protein